MMRNVLKINSTRITIYWEQRWNYCIPILTFLKTFTFLC